MQAVPLQFNTLARLRHISYDAAMRLAKTISMLFPSTQSPPDDPNAAECRAMPPVQNGDAALKAGQLVFAAICHPNDTHQGARKVYHEEHEPQTHPPYPYFICATSL